jgi:hypothetical protein
MRMPRHSLWTAAGLALALSALPATAVNEPPRPPQSALNKIRDLTATVRARRALQDDPALARLNLGVEVDNGVATVWGPVPSIAVGRVAAAKLEGLKGVTRVKSNFYVEERRDPLLDLVRTGGPPERVEVAKPRDAAVKVGRSAAEGPALLGPRPARPVPLAELAAQLQQSEPRFRAIGVEVRDGTVLVRRGAVPGPDVMDLANKLRRIPGVRDVILTGD